MAHSGFDRLLPPAELKDPEQARRARFVLAISGLSAVAAAAFIGVEWIRGERIGVYALIGATVVFALTPLVVRRTSSVVGTRILAGVVLLMLPALSIARGRFAAQVLMWGTMLPLATVLLGRRKEGVVWATAVTLEIAGVALLAKSGVAGMSRDIGAIPGLFGMVAFGTVFALAHEQTRARLQREKAELVQQAEARKRLEAMGRMAAGVAHEFNNLLTVIRTSAQSAHEQLPRESPAKVDTAAIIQAADDGAGIVRKMLSLKRHDSPAVEAHDLGEAVALLEPTLLRMLPANVRLGQSLARGAWIKLSAGDLEQVLLNLVSNACDAMSPGGGELRIGVHVANRHSSPDGILPSGSYCVLTVRDSGSGIADDVLPHVFDPFFTTKDPGHGTGLGLAGANRIVRSAGGDISITSTLGKGTSVEVLLPLADAPARPEPSPEPALTPMDGTRLWASTSQKLAALSPTGAETPSTIPPPESGISTPSRKPEAAKSRGSVLVVDDQRAVAMVAQRVLRRAGYEVLVAGSAREALELLSQRSAPIDVLLTDVVMPEMDGAELAAAVRERMAVPVIYMSGYSDHAVVSQEVENGEAWYLKKPFGSPDLAAFVDKVLEASRKHDVA